MHMKKLALGVSFILLLSVIGACTPEPVTETVKLTDTVTKTNTFTTTVPAVTLTEIVTETKTITETATSSTTEMSSTSSPIITSQEGIQLEIQYDDSALGHVWEQNTTVKVKSPGIVVAGKIYHNYGGDYTVNVTAELYDAGGALLGTDEQVLSVPGEYGRQFTFSFEMTDPSTVSKCIVLISIP
jgi:hypothetical protein